MNNITFVTGLWDLKRGEAKEGWNRSFDHYKESFQGLLTELKNHNLVVYIDPELEDFVWQHREHHNTRVVIHPKEKFNSDFFPFYDKIQKIRNKPEWYEQAGWLKDSTQGSLEWYNPMVMSKMFMLHNTMAGGYFNDDYLYWIDGGIKNTCSPGYLNDQIIMSNLKRISDKMIFICFPYETQSEIHGFDIKGMRKYANGQNVNRVARGGFFGGHKSSIAEANGLYYTLLDDSLSEGYMGTEESIFTLMTYLDPTTYKFEMIEGNGLVYKFFEDLRSKQFKSRNVKNVNLYLITYNSPKQVQMVLDSFEKFDRNFLTKPKLIMINNSTKKEYYAEYEDICERYNIEEHRFDNLGICGGRQWAAEDFDKSDADYSMFFEDDMLLDLNGKCKVGFSKHINQPYNTCVTIMAKEGYDFFKMCFSEFYGENTQQWAWTNLPADKKESLFPDYNTKPPTKYTSIKTYNGAPYAEGEVYYCNWPHLMSKEGNQKCFLDTKWAHPYEQTWMSHIYQLTREGKIRPGILLASPFTHNRTEHYAAAERREN